MATYKNQAVVLNYEDRVTLTIFRFETALTVVLLHIPKVALLVGGGALLGSIVPGLGTGLGAALGAGVGIGFMLSDVQLLMASIDRMVNTAMLPTDSWFCNKTNDFVGFTSMIAKTVNVNMTYRTVYNADANTTIPIAQKFIKGMADFRSGLNTIAQYLPASLRQSKIIQSVTNYKTLPLAVNSQQLSVSDISNNNVTLVNTDKTDGNLALRFKNSSATNQSFSFKLNYSNSSFGSFSRVIDASVSAVSDTVTDIDGNVYHTVQVGNQIWLVENLRTSRYRDGSPITTGLVDTLWSNAREGAYAILENDMQNDITYGKLYNWYAVADNRGLTPAGWHVPTEDEWNTLLGTYSSDQLKATTLWREPNTNNNITGFSALPAGFRAYSSGYFDKNLGAVWWTSTEINIDNARPKYMCYSGDSCWAHTFSVNIFSPEFYFKPSGYSIRCIKD